MNNLRLLFILFVVLGLIAFSQIGGQQNMQKKKTFLSPTPKVQKAKQSEKIIIPTQDTPPSPTPSSLHTELFYPSSRLIKNAEQSVILESVDDPDTVTLWYKDTIESMGMSSKSAIQIQTNDAVHNKIVGSNSDRKIMIDITRESGTQTVSIVITLTPS